MYPARPCLPAGWWDQAWVGCLGDQNAAFNVSTMRHALGSYLAVHTRHPKDGPYIGEKGSWR